MLICGTPRCGGPPARAFWIKKHFFFKDPSTYERGSQYWAFMKELTTYTRTGKVPHDDAPDSLSLLENEIRYLVGSKVEVIKRPV